MSSGSDGSFGLAGHSSPRIAKTREAAQTPWSSSPRDSPRSKHRRPEDSEAKKAQQMQAYVAWTNSQLKKLPGGKVVEDLSRDMQDGVALAQLIQIVAGEKIEIDLQPSSSAAMKENVEKILHFVSAKKIRLHHVSAKDIVNGNMKAIMHLILALAAHFKPSSVRSAVTTEPCVGRRVRRSESSLSAVAAEAAATLHDVSRAAASAGLQYSGSRLRPLKLLSSSPSTSSADSNDKEVKASQSEKPMSSTVSKIPLPAQIDKLKSGGKSHHFMKNVSPEDGGCVGESTVDVGDGGKGPRKRVAIGCRQWKEIVEGYCVMEEDVKETRRKLLKLQDILLNESVQDDLSSHVGDFSSLDGALLQEQITILNARLDQRSSEYDELKSEFNRNRAESINLQGIKHGLQSRLSDQEQVMMKLKAELLKLSFSHETTNSDKDELQRTLDERERELALLRSQLMSKDEQIVWQKKELSEALKRIADVDKVEKDLRSKIKKQEINAEALQSQVKELQQKLRSVDASEMKLSNRITYQDKKVSLLEDRLLREQAKPKLHEVDTVRQCLQGLRNAFPSQDSQHHTLDILEETLTSIVTGGFVQFPVNDAFKASPRNNNYQNGVSSPREIDIRKQSDGTEITYQLSWISDPSVVTVSQRLGDITLGDFKSLVNLPGQYRYYFKALDPEFGTIREEIVNDDDVLPGWDDKIMAWISDTEESAVNDVYDSLGHRFVKSKRSETDI